jgi:choline dehydrogenase-like flavoprotein
MPTPAVPALDRASLALVEAIIPGSRELPAADETTVRRAEEIVAHVHPSLVTAWVAAQRTLDAAAFPRSGRPFHALGAAAQDAMLRRWEQDPVISRALAFISLVYKMVHFDHPIEPPGPNSGAHRGALRVVRPAEEPRWLRQVHAGDTWEGGDLECDVVVVGSGAGGGVVGRELAARGLAVVFLEEGEHYQRDAFDGSSIRAHQRFYRTAFSVGNVVMPIFVGRMVGGSTAINGGTSFRTPPWILERWCEDLRTDEFAPDAMARHFERVEGTLDVRLSRREAIGPIADVMARGCDALGWSHFAIRRNAPDCDGSGFCDFGCPSGARRSVDVAYLPAAFNDGSVLLTGTRVVKVDMEGGRAVGVQGVTKSGRTLRVRSRAVVLAGGTIPTPVFLLEQGLCNTSGQVGRNLTIHPSCGISALFDEPINGHEHIPQGYGCDEFVREGMLMTTAQPSRNIAPVLFPFTGRRLMEALGGMDRIASFAVLLRDETRNGRVWGRDVAGVPAITYNVTARDTERMHQALVRAGEMCIAAGAKRLYPVFLPSTIVDPGPQFDAFRRAKAAPGDFVWLSYHPLGTCQMGQDPKTSVVGLDHETHDVAGLFVVDGSTVPGPLGVNPQLTIMAMATRAAEGIAAKLG